jgi:nucleotide-binding universal stress UspA family protein
MTPAGTEGSDRCLVVGYDRSDCARGAVAWAASELCGDGKLVLVHSSRGLHAPASPLSSSGERRELGRALIDELVLEADTSLLELDVEAVISEHDPVTALIDAAEHHGAQLIVVGCKQHSPLQKALGTVISELMDRSPVPVTAIGPQAAGVTPNR